MQIYFSTVDKYNQYVYYLNEYNFEIWLLQLKILIMQLLFSIGFLFK